MSLARKIAGLSPFGPVFGKELRVASRRRWNHILRVLYLGGLLLFLLMFFASMSLDSSYDNVAFRIQQQVQLGQTFFLVFGMFCIVCMGLIAPILTSTAINAERLAKTLPVLLMTPITAWQIVAGKLFARLLVALLLIGLSLPVLAVVRLLGGVELPQMIAAIALCTVFALSCGALGLFYSTRINRAYAVILMTYITMFVVYFLAPMFFVVVTRFRGSPSGILTIMALNPVMNMAMLTEPDPTIMTAGWFYHWVPGVLVQLTLTGLLLMASAAMLRRIARKEGSTAPSAPPLVESATETLAKRPDAMVGSNAVLWRELRRPLIAHGKGPIGAIAIVALLLISYAMFGNENLLDDEELQIGYAFIFNGLYWLVTAVLAATVITQEKESDTWTLLLASPISGGSIVVGKLLGVVRRMLWPSLLIVGHFGLFTLTGVISLMAFISVIWIILTFNTVWLAWGVYLSLRLRGVTTSVVVNLMTTVVLFGVIPLCLLILGLLVGDRRGWLAEMSLWLMPYPFLGTAVDSLSRPGNTVWLPGFSYYSQVRPMTFLTIIWILGMVHLVIAGLIVLHAATQFDAIVGRAPQRDMLARQGLPVAPSAAV